MTQHPSLATQLFNQSVVSLSDGASITTDEMDMGVYDKYLLSFISSSTGLTLNIKSRATLDDDFLSDSFTYDASLLFLGALPVRQRYLTFTLINNTGSTVTNANLSITGTLGSSDKTSCFPLSVSPRPFSLAALTQSVLTGKDPNGNFVNVGVNQAGALLISNFNEEIARGLYDGISYGVKFGRNPDIDTGTTPEDIYNGGDLYTGFNATGNEEITATSADNNDRGQLVSSGTVTGGSNTTLIDTGATFITDGVSIGDAVINDTQGIHGIITSVDSETQVTVFGMENGAGGVFINNSGDNYRIATSIDTGAAVLRLTSVLDENYVEQTPVYIILNGTTSVTTSGVNAMRCPAGRIILAGSSARNEGNITVTQAVSTSNVFCVIPNFGATTIGCFTVPAGKDCLITQINKSIVRANGAAGSATIALNVRRFGQAFTAERVYELSTNSSAPDRSIVGPFPPGTDIKGTVEFVSDNNTITEIEMEYKFIDR